MAEERHFVCRQGQDIISSLKDLDWLWRPPGQLGSRHSCVGNVGLKTELSLQKKEGCLVSQNTTIATVVF
jgi:hypothetical protein